jgi:cytochrome c-type biogenesis protein CcmH
MIYNTNYNSVEGKLMKRILIALLTTLGLALLIVSSGFAQDAKPTVPVTDDQVNAIASQLYCPVCENIPLDVCGTQACAQWRDLIRQQLSQGWMADQIKQYFVAQYGDRVLGTPPARGLNWLVYIVPPLAILSGAFILYRAFRAWKRPLPQQPVNDAPLNSTDEYVIRLEEELKKR